jgi:LCP family protein required for cell wall assembly
MADKDSNHSEHQRHHHHHHGRRKHLVRNVILVVLGILVLTGAAFAAVAFNNMNKATTNMYEKTGATKTRSAAKALSSKKPISILLMGTDTGALGRNYKGRTDTMIVMTINPTTKKTTMTSLPRDMEVNLPDYPEYSPAKINAAYAYGSSKEAINTVQKYLKIPIDYYVLVNMGGLEKAIDQVGGVTVTSPLTFSFEGYSFISGQSTTMDGEKALAFSRMRHEDPQGDYGRQTRQRLIIAALLKKSASYKTVLNRTFLNSISSEMKTDLTFSDMTKLALNYRNASSTVKSDHAQGTSESIGGQSFEVVSKTELQRVSNIIRDNLGLERANFGE